MRWVASLFLVKYHYISLFSFPRSYSIGLEPWCVQLLGRRWVTGTHSCTSDPLLTVELDTFWAWDWFLHGSVTSTRFNFEYLLWLLPKVLSVISYLRSFFFLLFILLLKPFRIEHDWPTDRPTDRPTDWAKTWPTKNVRLKTRPANCNRPTDRLSGCLCVMTTWEWLW